MKDPLMLNSLTGPILWAGGRRRVVVDKDGLICTQTYQNGAWMMSKRGFDNEELAIQDCQQQEAA
jgi:hypothetical protein